MEPSQPIHSDTHHSSFFGMLSPVIAVLVVVLGLLYLDPVFLILGIGFLTYVWFTRHTRYDIFHDRLVIHYGRPRQTVLPLTEIEDARLVQSGIGDQILFVRGVRGQRLVIRPSAPELFLERLDEARGQRGE